MGDSHTKKREKKVFKKIRQEGEKKKRKEVKHADLFFNSFSTFSLTLRKEEKTREKEETLIIQLV